MPGPDDPGALLTDLEAGIAAHLAATPRLYQPVEPLTAQVLAALYRAQRLHAPLDIAQFGVATGCTRNAIHQALHRLREAGYPITSSPTTPAGPAPVNLYHLGQDAPRERPRPPRSPRRRPGDSNEPAPDQDDDPPPAYAGSACIPTYDQPPPEGETYLAFCARLGIEPDPLKRPQRAAKPGQP